jgi:hypothetical protein
VGAIYTEPRLGQGQLPWMINRLRDVLISSCRAVPPSTM